MQTGILFLLLIGLVVALVFTTQQAKKSRQAAEAQLAAAKAQASEVITAQQARLTALDQEIEPYRPIQSVEARCQELQQQATSLQKEVKHHQRRLDGLQREITPLELESIAREFGIYEPKYDLGDSAKYKTALDALRKTQKELIRDNKAVAVPHAWTVNGSQAAGRKMLKEIAQLQLWAFNGETEALIQRVRFDNVTRIEQRIRELFKKVNVLDGETGSRLTDAFLTLKLQELYLVHEYQEKRQAEMEEQRAIREQMRDEERAQKELERAQAEALKEEQRYATALEKAQRDAATAQGARQAQLQQEIERLTLALEDAHRRQERALSMAQQTRAGHVYVISNIGSFGEDVYKIGMTRRLEPLDRVRELGDASVPFTFDVHAVIYSEDAPKLESDLHRAFSTRRVNQINHKKEFFRVTLDEIRTFVEQHHGEIDFTLAAEAADYRKTLALQA